MTQQAPSAIFDEAHAAIYDQRFAKLAPMKDALHLLMRLVLNECPVDANILCVGAGTGAELLYLAEAFPQWRFTALDPSGPMLNVCRQRAAAAGIEARCTFVEGYVDALPAGEAFDAATSILVSQFILQSSERQNFFAAIAGRLRPGGMLVDADLTRHPSAELHADLFEMWLRGWEHNGVSREQLEGMKTAYERDVAVLAPEPLEALIAAAGFAAPVQFFQTLLIRGWYARKQ